MVTVFAVPDSPTSKQGFSAVIILLTRYAVRTVSTVGTRIFENRPSSGGTYGFTKPFQDLQHRSAQSKIYSYSERDGSCVAAMRSPSTVPNPDKFFKN